MGVRGLALGCMACAVVACGDDAQEQVVALDDFCGELAASLCPALEECACGADAGTRCADIFSARCAAGLVTAELRRAVDEGRVVYDGAAAYALTRELAAAPAFCDSAANALGTSVSRLHGMGGVFTGTTPAGTACTPLGTPTFDLVSECAEGLCDRAGGVARCMALRDWGTPCDVDPVACVQLAGPARRWDRWTADLGGLCGADMLCGPRRDEGAACTADAECDSLHCAVPTGSTEGTCAALVGPDEVCFADNECESGYCLGAFPPGTCAPGVAALGAACTEDEECASDACLGGACVSPACRALAL